MEVILQSLKDLTYTLTKCPHQTVATEKMTIHSSHAIWNPSLKLNRIALVTNINLVGRVSEFLFLLGSVQPDPVPFSYITCFFLSA